MALVACVYDQSLASITGQMIEACFYPDTNGELAHWVVDTNGNFLDNEQGPEVWYTDPLGGHASQAPFPGSIRQFIARKPNADKFRFDGPGIGDDRDYGGNGVHAPN
ncbi:MAG: hypothetical protein ABI765_14530 [Gemmatimonadota bacterium]